MSRVAGVVLAAGAGSRLGQPKAELVVDGARLLDRAIEALTRGGCDPIVAVVRAGTPVSGATAVVNPDPDRGMRSSLELGSCAAAAQQVDAIAVLLVDMPGIGAVAVDAVRAGWVPDRIAIGRVGARRAHPTVMSPRRWAEAVAVAGADEGARRYLAAHPELVDEIAVDGDARDLDTVQELAAWRERRSQSGSQRGL